MGRYDFLLNADKGPRAQQGQSGKQAQQAHQAAQAIAQRSPLARGYASTQSAGDIQQTQQRQQTQEIPVHAGAHPPLSPALSLAPSPVPSPSAPTSPPDRSMAMAMTSGPNTTRSKPQAQAAEKAAGTAVTPETTGMTSTTPKEARNHGTVEPRKLSATSDSTESAAGFRFDATARADQKYTLAFTDQELEALEDVKIELRRRYDVRTTKTELVRCGLWDLIEDYGHHGEQSRLLQRLRTRAQRTTDAEDTEETDDTPD